MHNNYAMLPGCIRQPHLACLDKNSNFVITGGVIISGKGNRKVRTDSDYPFIMGMKLIISALIALRIFVYYYDDALTDIYSNFSLYFPFFNVTTYSDLYNVVLAPLFLQTGSRSSRTPVYLFTEDELKKYNGEDSNLLYLAVLGNVFDVTTGAAFYGVGKVYHGFTGKDGSRALISGEFTPEGLTDHVLDLPGSDLLGLDDWLKMYESKYEFKGTARFAMRHSIKFVEKYVEKYFPLVNLPPAGKLVGRYYDTAGEPTEYSEQLENKLREALAHKAAKSEDEKKFPPCNVEWTPEKGSRVWCTARSGGVERTWIGVPRKLYMPGSKSYRCACIDTTTQTDDGSKLYQKYFTEYEECDSNSHSCYVKV